MTDAVLPSSPRYGEWVCWYSHLDCFSEVQTGRGVGVRRAVDIFLLHLMLPLTDNCLSRAPYFFQGVGGLDLARPFLRGLQFDSATTPSSVTGDCRKSRDDTVHTRERKVPAMPTITATKDLEVHTAVNGLNGPPCSRELLYVRVRTRLKPSIGQ